MRRIIVSGQSDTIRAKVREAYDDLTEDGQGYVQAEGVEIEFAIIEEEDEIEDKDILSVHTEEVPD